MGTIQDILDVAKHLTHLDANEAETRLKVIDKILFEVLGWTHEDVTVEQRVSEDGKTTFADYIIRTANAALIVEAKKIGITFETRPLNRRLKLSKGNLSGSLGDAIVQARDYCRKLSIQFAVVTNGEQWVIFPANRIDQVAFHDSSAIVFNSLESALKDDYTEFSDLLSRKAVVNSSLENLLLGYTEDQIEERRLKNYHKTANYYESTNPMYPLIEEAITTAFSDTVTDMDPSLFEKCYVNSSDRMKFDRKINMHISKSQSLFNKQPVRPLQKRHNNTFKKVLSDAHKKAKPLAVVILGTVGSGKTTFQHYTRYVSAAKVFEKKDDNSHPHWVSIDFLGFTNDENPVDYIYSSLMHYIISDEYLSDFNECVKKAYNKEITAIKRGPSFLMAKNEEKLNEIISSRLQSDYDKKKPYVDTIISHISSKVPFYLVIDNVDQLEEITQSNIFTESVAFSQKLRLNLVISIRSSTYVEHRNSAAFNAFDFDPILIEPPKVESVLSKRFFLARNLIDGESGDFFSENGMNVHVENLASIIELVQSSVLGTEIGGLLEVLAADDIRNALRMTRHFLEHGYSNPGKAVQTYKSKGQYTLPKHEALRAILVGSHAVYSEEFSLIGNPFDSRLGRTNLQMVRFFILTALVKYSSDSSFQYLDGLEIRKVMRTIGIADECTLKALSDLCSLRFIHTASHDNPNFNSNYYPSRLGGYIVRELISNMTFIENIMMDTFISEDSTWNNLSDLGRKISNCHGDVIKRLELRIDRVIIFYAYINKLYESLLNETKKRQVPKEWKTNPFQDSCKTLEKNLEKAMDSAKRNYGNKEKYRPKKSPSYA
ncbi:type I restriction enzyme HsdR N-terminal domain-containing protein [Endozoicomonas sp. 4G]|uniref:type I restriction enzyme HsdR N-terminal domain-containing protein n=1 Tax=Endozoicomonas sp. 4G TaxID=2872754 RepID=UPI0020790A3D|nr:type I restriction enzyme HsdR N-terminal domain-containing protein [Endozoicomonas sp. 4G]